MKFSQACFWLDSLLLLLLTLQIHRLRSVMVTFHQIFPH
jgi:hypothetical protein